MEYIKILRQKVFELHDINKHLFNDHWRSNYEAAQIVLTMRFKERLHLVSEIEDLIQLGLFKPSEDGHHLISDYVFQGTNLFALDVEINDDGSMRIRKNIGTGYFGGRNDHSLAFGYALARKTFGDISTEYNQIIKRGEVIAVLAMKSNEIIEKIGPEYLTKFGGFIGNRSVYSVLNESFVFLLKPKDENFFSQLRSLVKIRSK